MLASLALLEVRATLGRIIVTEATKSRNAIGGDDAPMARLAAFLLGIVPSRTEHAEADASQNMECLPSEPNIESIV